MSKGKVRGYDQNRGHGAIIDSQTGQILTVYANYINLKDGETLHEGQEVEYDIRKENNDSWAVNVRVF